MKWFAGFTFNYRANFFPNKTIASASFSSLLFLVFLSFNWISSRFFSPQPALVCVIFKSVKFFLWNLFHQLRKHFWLKTSLSRTQNEASFIMTRLKDVMKFFFSSSRLPKHVSWLFGFFHVKNSKAQEEIGMAEIREERKAFLVNLNNGIANISFWTSFSQRLWSRWAFLHFASN